MPLVACVSCSPEEQAKEVEAKVHQMLEESAAAACTGDPNTGMLCHSHVKTPNKFLDRLRAFDRIGYSLKRHFSDTLYMIVAILDDVPRDPYNGALSSVAACLSVVTEG